MERIKERTGMTAALYAWAILGVFPLFVTNFYFNIQKSKSLFFIAATLIAAALILLVGGYKELFRKPAMEKEERRLHLLFVVFLLSQILSFVFSPYKDEAFWGEQGRYYGLLIHICFFPAFLIFSRFLEKPSQALIPFAVSAAFVLGLGVVNHLGFDPFGFYVGIQEKERQAYISTLGHINIFSSFVSMVLPLGIVAFCSTAGKRHYVSGAFVLLGWLALFAADSDSGFMAAGFLFLILLYCYLDDGRKLCCLLQCLMGLWLAGLLFWALRIYGGSQVFELSSLPLLFTKPAIFLKGAAGNGILLLICAKNQQRLRPSALLRKIRIGYALVTSALILAALVFLLSSIQDPSWNYRGYIWKRSLFLWKKSGPWWLTGFGPGTFRQVFKLFLEWESQQIFHYVYDNAHNEVLQYLVTSGLLGAVSWLSLMIYSMRVSLRRFRDNPWLLALGSSLVCYFVQSFVNVNQPVTSPLIYLLIGMIAWMLKKEKN